MRDLHPRDAVALDFDGRFLPLVAAAFEQGHDVDLQVTLRPPVYVVVLHVVAGERIVRAHELVVRRDRLQERVHLTLLHLHAASVLRRSELLRRQQEIVLAPILREKGLPPRRAARA